MPGKNTEEFEFRRDFVFIASDRAATPFKNNNGLAVMRVDQASLYLERNETTLWVVRLQKPVKRNLFGRHDGSHHRSSTAKTLDQEAIFHLVQDNDRIVNELRTYTSQ